MSYQIAVDRGRNVVNVEFSGEWEVSSAIVMLESIVETCRRERISKVLLDATRAAGGLTTVEQLEVATSLVATSRSAIAFSILCTPEQAEQSYLETFAVNRGGIVRILTDPDEALRWLVADPSSSNPGRIVG